MSKIIQFSTIGALMAGYFRGEYDASALKHPDAFGLGCSQGINGELTIFQGKVWEATAGEAPHLLRQEMLPFLQVTEFVPERTASVVNIDQHNAEQHLNQFIPLQNIFLAVCIEATFDHLVIRRPQPASDIPRDINDFARTQQEDTLNNINGYLIGFWTPALFGRISVPGFHFHFIDEKRNNSGHVLEFSAKKAILKYQEKQTIEVTNPGSAEYKNMTIDLSSLDKSIEHVEK